MLFRILALLLASTAAWAQLEIVTTDLQSPQKMVVLEDGSLLVSETSTAPNSGRISIVAAGGQRRTLIENLPSGLDVAGGASGPTALLRTPTGLLVALGGGDAERRSETGTSLFNPQGASSPLFASILDIDFGRRPNGFTGSFRFTPEIARTLADGGTAVLTNEAGERMMLRLLTRFPVAEPEAGVVYRFSNPWGMEREDRNSILVVDASSNTLIRVDLLTGRWERIVRFPAIRNIGRIGPPNVDAVPTNVRMYAGQALVSFLTGFPFAQGASRVQAVNLRNRTAEPFITGLNSAVDVLYRELPNGRSEFYVLEFSTNQLATPPGPGRLLRYASPQGEVVAGDLRAPVNLALDERTNTLYVLEITGRLLRLRLQ